MGLVDLILNIAGLLIWLNWRSIRFDPLARRLPSTLMGTLRPASPSPLRRWHFLALIVALLVLRAFIYRWFGGATGTTTVYLDFGATVQGFRHDSLLQTLSFSCFSFIRALGVLYIALLFFSCLDGPPPINGLIKVPLGRVNEFPRWLKLILPFLGTFLFWMLASWVFSKLPPGIHSTPAQRFQGSLVVALCSYLIWKLPLCGVLLLYLLSSYIYFGQHPFWNYIKVTAQTLLRPFKAIPLRVGRVDLMPMIAMSAFFLLFNFLERSLAWLYSHRVF